ncbi:hypothetical protein [Bacteroides sp.]
METKKIVRVRIDLSTKLSALIAYYSSDKSMYFISNEFGISLRSLLRFKDSFETSPESLSLSDELLTKLSDMRKKRLESKLSLPDSSTVLKEENARLRQALEYSELRNEALQELLKIGREEYGIDLLKKAGAKQ